MEVETDRQADEVLSVPAECQDRKVGDTVLPHSIEAQFWGLSSYLGIEEKGLFRIRDFLTMLQIKEMQKVAGEWQNEKTDLLFLDYLNRRRNSMSPFRHRQR